MTNYEKMCREYSQAIDSLLNLVEGNKGRLATQVNEICVSVDQAVAEIAEETDAEEE